jgi:hypothetical protein
MEVIAAAQDLAIHHLVGELLLGAIAIALLVVIADK